MFDIIIEIFGVIFAFLKLPLFLFIFVSGLFLLLVFINCVFFRAKGIKPSKSTSFTPQKKVGILKRLCFLLPRQYAYDIMTADKDRFPYKGMIIYTGRQGNGKTISLVRDMMLMQKEYSKCKVITNLAYKYENNSLKHWKQLTNYNNGKYGVICAIDETQNWFSSNQSKNFPPEMLQTITQNRKNARIILGTAQNFYLLAKAIRSQTTEVRECFTLFGCLTVVHRREPILDTDGNVVEFKNLGWYFFVHNNEIRDSYDTYKVIETLAKSGFVEKPIDK